MLKSAKIRLPFFPPYVERIIISLIVELLIDFLEHFQLNGCGEESDVQKNDQEDDDNNDDYEDDGDYLVS